LGTYQSLVFAAIRMDKIILKNIHLRGIIGVYDWERSLPQEIIVNLTLFTDIRKAAQSDDIKDCVDYDVLTQKIRAHVETASRMTLEALAEDLARVCLNEKGVERVIVRVEKPGAMASVESAGVEIRRP
jgi:FolB domain-containing protein